MAPSHRRFALMLSCATLLALAIAATRAEDVKSLRRVLLSMYSVAPDLGDAPLWMLPHALGFFADAGLNVGVEYAGGSSGALQLVAARFAAQANDFDAEAVRRQAKSLTDAMIRYPSP